MGSKTVVFLKRTITPHGTFSEGDVFTFSDSTMISELLKLECAKLYTATKVKGK